MGLLDKIKNVLFEEEEIEIPIVSKEQRHEEKPKKEEIVKDNLKFKKEEVKVEEIKPIVRNVELKPKKELEKTKEIEILDRDEFKSKSTFEFPVFDESDFSNTKELKRSTNNILEYEKRKTTGPRKVDFGKYEEKATPKPEKLFKPTPIISPVYGVLDQNYKKEEIVEKSKPATTTSKKIYDIDQIRNKAYGKLEDEIENTLTSIATINEDYEEIIEPTKTIDELLMDTITEDVTIGELIERDSKIDSNEDLVEDNDEIKESLGTTDLNKTLNLLDEIETEIEQAKKNKEKLENDTLETDLFNLIDSMYETKEEEEGE